MKSVSFGRGALRNHELLVGGGETVVEAGDGGDESAAGDLQFGGGNGGGGVCAPQAGDLGQSDVFVDDGLAGILVHRVVGDKDWRRLRRWHPGRPGL